MESRQSLESASDSQSFGSIRSRTRCVRTRLLHLLTITHPSIHPSFFSCRDGLREDSVCVRPDPRTVSPNLLYSTSQQQPSAPPSSTGLVQLQPVAVLLWLRPGLAHLAPVPLTVGPDKLPLPPALALALDLPPSPRPPSRPLALVAHALLRLPTADTRRVGQGTDGRETGFRAGWGEGE